MKKKLDEINKLKEDIKVLEAATDTLYKKKNMLLKEVKRYILKNKLYKPMEDLKEFEGLGKYIEEVTLVQRVRRGETNELYTDTLYAGDISKVENGRLNFSDFEAGIIEWDNDKKCYKHTYYGYVTYIDIVGFYNLIDEDGVTHYALEELVKDVSLI